MRLSLILALTLAGMAAVPATAYQKPRTKPSYTSDKPAKKNSGGHAAATPNERSSSAAQELRRVEQSSAKVNGTGKTGAAKSSAPRAVKADKSGVNPPIRLSGNGKGNGPKGKTADPAKGRLRQKNH